MKNIFVVVGCLCLPACVTIESPDNLISDTIKAGKEVYQDIKKGKDNRESEQETKTEPADTSVVVVSEMDKVENTFINTYPLENMDNELNAMQTCMSELIEDTRRSLNLYSLDVLSRTYETITADNVDVIQCKITIKR
jgi:hypothetical protein